MTRAYHIIVLMFALIIISLLQVNCSQRSEVAKQVETAPVERNTSDVVEVKSVGKEANTNTPLPKDGSTTSNEQTAKHKTASDSVPEAKKPQSSMNNEAQLQGVDSGIAGGVANGVVGGASVNREVGALSGGVSDATPPPPPPEPRPESVRRDADVKAKVSPSPAKKADPTNSPATSSMIGRRAEAKGVAPSISRSTSDSRQAPPRDKSRPKEEAEPVSGEKYNHYEANKKTDTVFDRFSTFAVDVDTASYAMSRRKLSQGQLPPTDAVRVEEFVNYFKYNYPQPKSIHPFSLTLEAAPSPFNQKKYIMRVGVHGREVAPDQRPDAHLTFLVDVSGSMNQPDKIGMLKESLKMLVNNLRPSDTVAVTTYAGRTELLLAPTKVANKAAIISVIENLHTGGGTAMQSGINLAYQQASLNLHKGDINRVVICSDGDANIGRTSPTEILKEIEQYTKQGITVSTIGFGEGNYHDAMMQQFADKGDGNYYYIDNLLQAKRVFVENLTSTIEVIAKDVKVQVEFNPAAVANYRLIGYEKRDIADEDFRNDEVDAGEIGAGHTVTALYEVELRAQPDAEIATVRLRYKQPEGDDVAKEVETKFTTARLQQNFDGASDDFRFATAVGAFAEILRNSPAAKTWTLNAVQTIARKAAPPNSQERQEFLSLVSKAQSLRGYIQQ